MEAKHKARCVAKGFLAQIGLDYSATYAPTTYLTTGRLLMACAVKNQLPVAHADIPQAFLQSEIDRKIYVELPPGIGIDPEVMKLLYNKDTEPKRPTFRLLKSLDLIIRRVFGLAISTSS
mmetsp:Transcript_14371/g.19209  ORF Transcript_14371/g.19209 Transcript_14371/m.19209 type:complete len:120 (-) Transcript_14371:2322-2681(-)